VWSGGVNWGEQTKGDEKEGCGVNRKVKKAMLKKRVTHAGLG